MCEVVSKFTVFFEEPFWVGIYEREVKGVYEVCKITFGAEPKDYEVYDFMLKSYGKLIFCSTQQESNVSKKRVNPKRMQRTIKKQLLETGVGTKAQQALKLQQEQNKMVRKASCRKQRENEKQYQFELHQEKRKEKRRGH